MGETLWENDHVRSNVMGFKVSSAAPGESERVARRRPEI
jgi:hypothetical protein